MPVKRYYVRKKEINNNRMLDGRVGNSSELLDLKGYVQDVIDEHVTIDEGILSSDTVLTLSAGTELDLTAAENLDLNAGTSGTVDAATTLALTSGTGTTVTATTGHVTLTVTHANGRVRVDGTKFLVNALAVLLENATAYANDAAAATGNINVGALYIHTDGFIHARLS